MDNTVTLSPGEYAPCFRVLGVCVNAVQISDVIARMVIWIRERRAAHYITVTGMTGIMEARRDFHYRSILNAADLVVPDGMPLIWLGRWHGYALARRVYGPELMDEFCSKTGVQCKHFFYGGVPGVPKQLAQTLHCRHGIRVAGSYSPPFRPLTLEEDAEVVAMIERTAPDVLWVGLGAPKQENWMYEHRDRLTVPVMVGVGAAFDFHTGRLKQAPRWMRESGFECFFRLLAEPRRLWRRYLIYGSQFVWNASLEILGIKKFN